MATADVKQLRWGILGTGNIARQFCAGAASLQRGSIVVVGSRAKDAADRFASENAIPRAVGSYQAVLADKSVDAVYVSLPNSLHHEWTIAALRAGKHVLCEKPIASNAAEAEEMFDVARQTGLTLMEAFMYRCHPQTLAVVAAVKSGAIGELKLIRTSFCYRTSRVEKNIRFSAELAGGVLMDVGCYCINFSRLLAGGEPDSIGATGHMHANGVDDLAVGLMRFSGSVVASFTCGMGVQADNTAYVCGSEGYIEIPVPWKPPVHNASWTLAHSTPPRMDAAGKLSGAAPPRKTFTTDAGKDLYALEADDFAESVLDGKPLRITPADTLGNMRVLDRMRELIRR